MLSIKRQLSFSFLPCFLPILCHSTEELAWQGRILLGQCEPGVGRGEETEADQFLLGFVTVQPDLSGMVPVYICS